jgi:hypothetical protein
VYFKKWLIVLAVIVGLAGAEVQAQTWQSKMTELSKALSDIVPDLFGVSSVRDKQAFKDKAGKIYAISSQLDQSSGHGVKTPDGDPTIPYIAEMFRKDIERAYHSIEEGQIEYAKDLLRSSVSYCIACHTRSQMGPKFPLLNAFSEPLKKAPWIDRISFQAASRQFDAVNDSVMEQLSKTKAANRVDPIQIEKSVRIALAVAVRVKQDPEAAAKLAGQVMQSAVTASDLKRNAEQWNKDILVWKAERKKTYASDKEMIEAARALIGKSVDDKYSSLRPGSEIRYLRSSLIMHDLLGRYPQSPYLAEALFLIGLSYDVLQDLGLWSLHEMYYQACIEKQPHSRLAQRCYERYKDSIVLGYSGSSGTHIPGPVSMDLSRLEALAKPGKVGP